MKDKRSKNKTQKPSELSAINSKPSKHNGIMIKCVAEFAWMKPRWEFTKGNKTLVLCMCVYCQVSPVVQLRAMLWAWPFDLKGCLRTGITTTAAGGHGRYDCIVCPHNMTPDLKQAVVCSCR